MPRSPLQLLLLLWPLCGVCRRHGPASLGGGVTVMQGVTSVSVSLKIFTMLQLASCMTACMTACMKASMTAFVTAWMTACMAACMTAVMQGVPSMSVSLKIFQTRLGVDRVKPWN